MPGRTRQQTRDAIQLVEENFDNFYSDCAMMSAVTNTGQNDEPRNFQEAWYHQHAEKRQNWRVAIRKEFKDMIHRGVWDVIERSSIPEGRRLIGSKWVYKEKRDGRFRACWGIRGWGCLNFARASGT